MNKEPNSTYLKHYGVKGMRWGVRKSYKRSKGSKDYKQVKALRKKKAKDLSNKEMQRILRRADLEKKYNELNPSTIARGTNLVNKYVSMTGKVAALGGAAAVSIKVGKKLFSAGKTVSDFSKAYPYLKKAASSLN